MTNMRYEHACGLTFPKKVVFPFLLSDSKSVTLLIPTKPVTLVKLVLLVTLPNSAMIKS